MTYTQRSLDLARRALGSTSPNPSVGAVVVRDGDVVGEGYTQPPGGNHAEIVALEKAGALANGAKLYVSLEPCSRAGRTQPCTNAILAAGIAQVSVGLIDPNPQENGRGLQVLREAGLDVQVCDENHEGLLAARLVEAYSKHVTTGRPFITSKFAMSLDGKIAAQNGSSTWITGDLSRSRAHSFRMESDAVMVGIGTILADNPRLTARGKGYDLSRYQPVRVIVDSAGRVPLESVVVSDGGATLVACTSMDGSKKSDLEDRGVGVEILPECSGKVDLATLIERLGTRGLTSVLVEGGGAIAGSLFDAGLVDKVISFVAPVILGGQNAPGPVAGNGVEDIEKALRLRDVTWECLEEDLLMIGYSR